VSVVFVSKGFLADSPPFGMITLRERQHSSLPRYFAVRQRQCHRPHNLAPTSAALSHLINNSVAMTLLFASKNQPLRRSPNFNRSLLAILRRSLGPVRLSIIPYVSTAAAGPQAVTCDSTCHDAHGESRSSVKTFS
jgi:hypothetical protein